MRSLATTLREFEPAFAAPLNSPGAYARLHEMALQLPAALSSCLYLECHLARPESRTDLILGVDAPGRDLVTRAADRRTLPPRPDASPAWRCIAALCRRWAQPHARDHGSIRRLWLEFDVDPRDSAIGVRVPGVFIEWSRAPSHPSASIEEHVCVAREAALALIGPAAAAKLDDTLQRSIRALPDGAYVAYLGHLPRGRRTLRCCIAGLPLRDLPRYLAAIGWPGPLVEAARVTRDVDRYRYGASLRDPGLIHLDLGATPDPVLGLEYVFARRPQLQGHIEETDFLQHLTELGLCRADEVQALLRWPGYSFHHFDHQLWPSIAVRRVNHVKITIARGFVVRAKGYLTVNYTRVHSRRSPPIEHQL